MILVDVNILVYAHRPEAVRHEEYRHWLQDVLNGDQAYGMADLVLSGFLRIVTHPGICKDPTPVQTALSFVSQLRNRPNCVRIHPGPRHWEIFERLCTAAHARGNLIPDAYLAALAIESGCEWITTDRDYSRFPGLRWRCPLR